MSRTPDILMLGSLFAALGCSTDPLLQSTTAALTSAQQSVLGFESPAQDWSAPVSIGTSNTASEGAHSASLVPNGWTEVKSVALGSLGPVATSVSYDIFLPQAASWGETRMIVTLPSRGFYWQELGSQSLVGMPDGSFRTVTFPLPASLVTALDATYSDLQLHIIINAPTFSAPYLLDHVNIAGSGGGGTPPPSAGSMLSITVPRGVPLSSAFISATQRLQIDDQVTLAQSGQLPTIASLGSGGAELGSKVFAYTNVVSLADVTLRSSAHVVGSVTTAGRIHPQDGVIVDGARNEGAQVTPVTTSWTVNFPASSAATVVAGPDGPLTPIAPGAYGGIDVRSRGRVSLSAGTYFLGYFNTEPQAEIQLDTSRGAIFLYVRDSFTYKGAFTTVAGAEGKLLVGYFGTPAAFLQAPFVGTMVAPNALVQIERPDSGQHKGTFFGAQIEAFSNASIGFLPFDFSFICPRGDTDKDGVSDCTDLCFKDPLKTTPGICGCGKAETDSDGDGSPNCVDECPNDPSSQRAGICGCGGSAAPAGTPCDDGVCRGVFACNGSGQCGDPNQCVPVPGCVSKFFQGKYYWFCPGPMSWVGALAACRGNQTALAQIDSDAENTFVASNLRGASAWIGANDRLVETQWRWARVSTESGDRLWMGTTSGSRYFARYTDWAAGSPSAGLQRCASISAAGPWTNVDCDLTGGFVCEVPTDRTVTITKDPPKTCQILGIPCETPQTSAECTTEADVFGSLTKDQLFANADACNQACQDNGSDSQQCADACQGPLAPPPAGSTCPSPEFTDQEGAACALASVTNPPQACSQDSDCPSGLSCGFYYPCRAASNDAACTGLTASDDSNAGDASKVCGTPVEGCPKIDDANFPQLCSETELCGDLSQTVSDPFGDGNDLSPEEFVPEREFPAPDSPSQTQPYADQSNPCNGPCTRDQSHPWCTLGMADTLTDRPSQQPDKPGRSDGSLVSFDFDPKLRLDHTLTIGPFGIPDLDVGAEAGFSASVTLNLPANINVTSNILDAHADLEAKNCSVSSDLALSVFGQDFLPLIEQAFGSQAEFGIPAKLPSDDRQAACEKAFSTFRTAGNRAKKALRDAVELIKQYRARVANDATNTADNFSQALCSQIVGSPPRGFPPGNCATESPEQTINRFIEYYRRTVLGFAGSDGAGSQLLGLTEAADAFANIDSGALQMQHPFTLYDFQKDEESSLFSSQFFVGPIPVNLELLATMHYGARISANVDFSPGLVVQQMLINGSDDAAQEVAYVQVDGTPDAGAGLALFAGIGFSINSLTAKIGIESALSLGEIHVPAHAGAGVGLGSTNDQRDPPADVAPFVTGVNLIPAKRYVADLRYDAGLAIKLRNILSGDIAAKLKLKFTFFSKTWRKTLLNFKGFCAGSADADLGSPCDLTLVSLAGSTDAAKGPFPWGEVRSEMPFPELAPLTGSAPRGTGTVNQSVVAAFFYDSLCTCIDSSKAGETRECVRDGDCCAQTPICGVNPAGGKHECVACMGNTWVCTSDSECCSGLCFGLGANTTGVCQGFKVCNQTCTRNEECAFPLDCEQGFCNGPGTTCHVN